jgi:hypothetical protein
VDLFFLTIVINLRHHIDYLVAEAFLGCYLDRSDSWHRNLRFLLRKYIIPLDISVESKVEDLEAKQASFEAVAERLEALELRKSIAIINCTKIVHSSLLTSRSRTPIATSKR